MNFNKLDKYLKTMQSKNVPLGSLKVVYKGNEVYSYTFGLKEDKKTPIKSDEIFYLYSSTKVVTAVAAMQLVEKGKIILDSAVCDYIPEYQNLYIGEKHIEAKNVLTVRDLFSMQGGFGYNFESPHFKKACENKSASTLDIIKALALDPINFEPGTKFEYGFGLDILAAIIEVVSGMKFSEYVKQNIFIPLGMNKSYFKVTDDLLQEMWPQYRYKDGKFIYEPKVNRFILNDEFESGGAGLISTVDDYIKFIKALANYGICDNGFQLLTCESIDEMRKDQLGENVRDFIKPDYSYGLGVRTLINKENSRSPIGEFGWDSAGCAYSLVDVDNNLGLFFGCHVLGWGEGYSYHNQIRDLVYESLGI